jgi:hypothetical protein
VTSRAFPQGRTSKSLVAVAIIQFCHLGGGVWFPQNHSQVTTQLRKALLEEIGFENAPVHILVPLAASDDARGILGFA